MSDLSVWSLIHLVCPVVSDPDILVGHFGLGRTWEWILRKLFSNFEQLPVNLSCKLFDTLIRPIISYNCEIWYMNEYLPGHFGRTFWSWSDVRVDIKRFFFTYLEPGEYVKHFVIDDGQSCMCVLGVLILTLYQTRRMGSHVCVFYEF
jgi:hypothetical protein